MIEIYEKRGVSSKDANLIIKTLAKYPKVFVENMMVDELGLMPIIRCQVNRGQNNLYYGFYENNLYYIANLT